MRSRAVRAAIVAVLATAATALWQGPGRATVAFIAVHVVVVFLVEWLLSWRRSTARHDGYGYKRLTFSRSLWFVFLGSAALASLILYVHLFVGSARADATEQHFSMRLLIAGSGGSTLCCGWVLLMHQVTWNEQEISRRTLTGQVISMRWSHVVEFHMTTLGVELRGADDTKLYVHSHFDGLPELIADARRLAPLAMER